MPASPRTSPRRRQHAQPGRLGDLGGEQLHGVQPDLRRLLDDRPRRPSRSSHSAAAAGLRPWRTRGPSPNLDDVLGQLERKRHGAGSFRAFGCDRGVAQVWLREPSTPDFSERMYAAVSAAATPTCGQPSPAGQFRRAGGGRSVNLPPRESLSGTGEQRGGPRSRHLAWQSLRPTVIIWTMSTPALILLSAVVLLACVSLGAASTRASSSTRSGQDVPRSFRPSTAVSHAGDSGFRCTARSRSYSSRP